VNEEKYPIEKWKNDVTYGDTILGYEDWVRHQIESNPIIVAVIKDDKIEIAVIYFNTQLATDDFIMKCQNYGANIGDVAAALVDNLFIGETHTICMFCSRIKESL
jgi:hypothetical protein